MQATVVEASETGDENENWYTPSFQLKKNHDDDAIFIDENDAKPTSEDSQPTTKIPSSKAQISQQDALNEYEDIENYEDTSLALDAESTINTPGENEDGIIHCRRYDVYICYDNYYRTPRVYLFGYDDTSAHHPLSPDRIMEDIIQDYINKTVTIEPHPHYATSTPTASIHPCQHANAMKRIIDEMVILSLEEKKTHEVDHESKKPTKVGEVQGTGAPVVTVNQYLFIFLKFLQSVIPTIEYDYTIDVQVKGRG